MNYLEYTSILLSDRPELRTPEVAMLLKPVVRSLRRNTAQQIALLRDTAQKLGLPSELCASPVVLKNFLNELRVRLNRLLYIEEKKLQAGDEVLLNGAVPATVHSINKDWTITIQLANGRKPHISPFGVEKK